MVTKDLLNKDLGGASWKAFIAETYGSTADAPIERGEQGSYEVREPLEEPLEISISYSSPPPGHKCPGYAKQPGEPD